ncbi:MAG: Ribose transport system permease protein RbsC [Firmicutes bacterium ADurb.Bin467]|jgi:ribose transport system permease protein|nr:MAG: Ribose transport system permease protein RbsC [Firmicutes bacterium ADurb.Bin467]
MKKRMKILLILCLVLGVALLGINLYTQGSAGRIAELQAKIAERKQLIAQAEMARVLGREAVDVGELPEVEISSADRVVMALASFSGAFLVLGIDLLIGALALIAFHLFKRRRGERKVRKVSSANNIVGILIALIVLCLDLSIASKVFLTQSNFLNVLQQISINFVIAIGMTFVIISGGIDLSVGSNIALTGLLMAIMMKNWGVGVTWTIVLSLLFSAAIGLINGSLIAFLNLPPFIATLGMMSIARGAAYTVTGGAPIYTMPAGFTGISGRVANVPLYAILIMIAVFALGWYCLRYTKVGRFTYAIGGNESCAKLSGINLSKVKCFVYVVSGLCCGVAAILLTSRLDSALPTNADGQEMDAIAAVVIGGTSMKGGEGSIIGTLIGILIIGVISNGLNLLGVAQGPQKMVKGLIIVVAVIIDVLRRRAAEQSK